MTYNPQIHHRQSIRLKEYDYSQNGTYFITICTQNRLDLFGEIENGEMILNDAGKMVKKWWHEIRNKFPGVELDQNVIMPNHCHGIIKITGKTNPVGAPLVGAQNVQTQNVQTKNMGARNVQTQNANVNVQNANIDVQNENVDVQNENVDVQNENVVNQNNIIGDQNIFRRAGTRPAPTTNIYDIVGFFKSITTFEYVNGVKHCGWPSFTGKLWQRNYYEHIIRDEIAFRKITEYIINNPLNWLQDRNIK